MARRPKKRRKRDKKKGDHLRQHTKPVKPDEMFEHGPLRMARFGKLTVMQNLMNKEQHSEYVALAAADYPVVCAEISEHVQAAIEIVRRIDPLTLLQRAFSDFALTIMKAGPEESSHGAKEMVAKDMITYVQKLVCAVGPNTKAPQVSDEDYKNLRSHVESLSTLFTPRYYIARTAVLKQRPDYDAELDEFGVYAEGHWLNVSGDRYSFHDPIHLDELLAEHDDTLQSVFGVSVDDIVRGVKAIQRSLTFGLRDASDILHREHEAFKHFLDDNPQATMKDVEEFTNAQKAEGQLDEAAEALFGLALFDVAKITGWPQPFIEPLSAAPGTDTKFVEHHEKGGWPTQPSITMLRPFLMHNGQAFVFSQVQCMDTLYRAIEHALVNAKPALRDGWNERQKRTTERLMLEQLSRALPDAMILANVYYQTFDPTTSRTEWVECDGVVIYDNHLIVAEIKGGAFSLKSPALSPKPQLDSLKKLVRDPIEQGRRFVRQLCQSGKIELFDEKRKRIMTIENVFDEVAIVCVTLDQLTDYAPQIEHFRLVGVDHSTEPVWTVSIDDLRVVTELLDNPIVFMHFVQERLRAFSSPAIRMVDELDHLGAYFEHNMYCDYAASFDAKNPMGWIGYRDKIDRHYHDKLIGKPDPEQVQPALPNRVAEIITLLAQQRKTGHLLVGKRLLDAHPDARAEISGMIDESLSLQSVQRRPRPLSSFGDFRITVFTNQAGCVNVPWDDARLHGYAVLQAEGKKDRVLLALDYDTSGILLNVEFEVLIEEDLKRIDEDIIGPIRRSLLQTRRNLDPNLIRRTPK